MALNSLFIRVTNLTAAVMYLTDLAAGEVGTNSAMRSRRPGRVYVPANNSVELALDSTVLLSYENGDIRKQITAGNLSASLVGGTTQVLTWQYDFADDAGAVSTITLDDIQDVTKTLNNAIVVRGWVEVITACTSAGAATVSVGITGTVAGFRTATAVGALTAGAILPFNGSLVHNGTAAVDPLAYRTTTARNVVAAIAVAALTAGKFNVHMEVVPVFV